jgi:hypothetical protein
MTRTGHTQSLRKTVYVLVTLAKPASQPPKATAEDVTATPYISQNYRFTDDELRWLRLQVFRLRERFGTKVSQNTILRVALAHLREACDKNPRNNPLIDAASRLKK